jgi:type IX secretion system PorP/SprF family membrane protein
MKINSRYIVVLSFLFLSKLVDLSAQQNIQFTQYIFNSLSVNPAYAGYKEEWFLQSTVRSQWMGMPGAPRTLQLSVDGVTNPDSKNVGVGLQLTADQLGAQTARSLYANYAYRIQLDAEDTKRLSLGLGAGLTQYGLDASQLDPIEKNDRVLVGNDVNNYIPDVRFGVYYASPKYYFGISVMDLLSAGLFSGGKADSSNVLRKQHLYIITGTLFDVSETFRIRPGVLIKEDFKGPTCVDVNAMCIYNNRFWFGASYRTGLALWNKKYAVNQKLGLLNSISGIVQLQMTDNFRIGYSYDYMINGLGSAQSGTHEISIGWTLPINSQRVLSPRFF